jgi:lipopolysaccharide/colanic/teichoic acid biosynthesis glycosyltransferase
VLKGEMSFIGPRPERPEFVKELKGKIPYYSLRHTIKPGSWQESVGASSSVKRRS